MSSDPIPMIRPGAPVATVDDSLKPGKLSTLRGERMLSQFTLRGHPVTFSGVEVLLAAWLALWLPGYLMSENFSLSVELLSDATREVIPPWGVAALIGLLGILHLLILALAWFGIARPPRKWRLAFNLVTVSLYGYISGVAVALDVYTTAGPYVVLTLLALGNLQRAVRNGRGYRADRAV